MWTYHKYRMINWEFYWPLIYIIYTKKRNKKRGGWNSFINFYGSYILWIFMEYIAHEKVKKRSFINFANVNEFPIGHD